MGAALATSQWELCPPLGAAAAAQARHERAMDRHAYATFAPGFSVLALNSQHASTYAALHCCFLTILRLPFLGLHTKKVVAFLTEASASSATSISLCMPAIYFALNLK